MKTLMVNFVVLALLIFPVFGFKMNVKVPVKWVLTKKCTFKVVGSTNINKFSCSIPENAKPDTLSFYDDHKLDLVRISGSMSLDVMKFDCNHPVMTSDLRKTLKVKLYPKIVIKFLSLSKYPELFDREETLKGVVTIELAGVLKKFEVDYKYVMGRNGDLTLLGARDVNFSDFNIMPPRKLGGMIKTNNKLKVEFLLNIKILK